MLFQLEKGLLAITRRYVLNRDKYHVIKTNTSVCSWHVYNFPRELYIFIIKGNAINFFTSNKCHFTKSNYKYRLVIIGICIPSTFLRSVLK